MTFMNAYHHVYSVFIKINLENPSALGLTLFLKIEVEPL